MILTFPAARDRLHRRANNALDLAASNGRSQVILTRGTRESPDDWRLLTYHLEREHGVYVVSIGEDLMLVGWRHDAPRKAS